MDKKAEKLRAAYEPYKDGPAKGLTPQEVESLIPKLETLFKKYRDLRESIEGSNPPRNKPYFRGPPPSGLMSMDNNVADSGT